MANEKEINPVQVLAVRSNTTTVDHPPTCVFNPDAGEDEDRYSCGVGWEVDEFGIDAFFRSQFVTAVPPKWEHRPYLIDGRYFIERYEDSSRGHWFYGDEPDSGLRLVYPEEAQG